MGAHLLAPPRACLAMALVAAALLAAALGLQYLWGLAPCQLCIWQRYPYVVLVVLGAIGTAWQPRLILALVVLTLLVGAGLAAYHVGVEQGWLALPESCTAGARATSVEDLRRLLAEAPPACDQVRFTLLGLSLAAWNLVASLALAGLAGWVMLSGPALADREVDQPG